ncbi:SH3 domain-containing protein [Arvimicrobium flavum]|uniref:SH3 domain-containing protein n=1 Tax=Arvimicrobium flavum TaxID=3393320 RepID=UPI00237A8B49|nr:SH3 domain-containing protein [Mesorhizobium shangrilense]
MRFPAENARRPRTVIQWQDDGPAPRVRNLLSEDVSPFKALGLAAVLCVASIAAVVAVIQFQRQGGLPEVGSLVERAQASVATAFPKAPEPDTTTAEATAQPASVDAMPIEPTAPRASSALSTSPPADVELPDAVAMQEVEPSGTAGIILAEATAPDQGDVELELEPLTKNDPRWIDSGVEPISIDAMDLSRVAALADEPMALTPAGAPVVIQEPDPAPKVEPMEVAAIEKAPTSMAVGFDTGLSNARVRTAVFLRSRPADGSKVIVTIPGGASIQAPASCKHWCQVSYQGRRGFIYKSFVLR